MQCAEQSQGALSRKHCSLTTVHSVDGREQCADEAEVPNCFVAALWRTSGQAPITSTTQVLRNFSAQYYRHYKEKVVELQLKICSNYSIFAMIN